VVWPALIDVGPTQWDWSSVTRVMC
jgi:hypothetical protein